MVSCHRYPSCAKEPTGFRSLFGSIHFVDSIRVVHSFGSCSSCIRTETCTHSKSNNLNLFSVQAKHCHQDIRPFVYSSFRPKNDQKYHCSTVRSYFGAKGGIRNAALTRNLGYCAYTAIQYWERRRSHAALSTDQRIIPRALRCHCRLI